MVFEVWNQNRDRVVAGIGMGRFVDLLKQQFGIFLREQADFYDREKTKGRSCEWPFVRKLELKKLIT